MAHVCSTALVRCMDFRLGSAVREYLEANNLYNDVDIISLAGAAKDIAQTDDSVAETQVDLSKKLHDIKTVILMNHTDCGGYGGRAAFDSDEAEREGHVADMRAAKAKIVAKHEGVEVKIALAKIGEGGAVEIEEIE
jgi:carbonic anhydrase